MENHYSDSTITNSYFTGNTKTSNIHTYTHTYIH